MIKTRKMQKITLKPPRQILRAITSICLMSLTTANALDKCILDNGAIPDGVTINTLAIQKTIDDVHVAGGGKVIVPQGKFVTGTLYLKSHVTLFLDGAAELLGSRSLEDYPTDIPGSGEVAANQKTPPPGALPSSEFIQALIVADQATDIKSLRRWPAFFFFTVDPTSGMNAIPSAACAIW